MLLPLLFLSSMVPVQIAPGARVNGSGVLIHSNFVLTAAHVVDHSPVVAVRCASLEIPAAVIAMDQEADLAVLELAQPCPLPPSPIAKVNAPAGEFVRAEGCPRAKCGWKLYGYVAGYDIIPSPLSTPRTMLITDVPVWFGNSGGPLYDTKGRIVGICSQIVPLEGPVPQWVRIFAAFVPAETIVPFLEKVFKS